MRPLARVLIIDDDRDSSEVVAGFLAKAGHVAVCACSAREALALLSDGEAPAPDAVLLDVRMPGMDGMAVLAVLRSYLRWATLPVALFTAYPEDPRLWHVHESGVTHVFAKSKCRLDDVLEWVEQRAGRATPPGGVNPCQPPDANFPA
jgi:CheY-like chemotaxis protein